MKRLAVFILPVFMIFGVVGISQAFMFSFDGPPANNVDTPPSSPTSVFLDVLPNGIITDLNLEILTGDDPNVTFDSPDNLDIFLAHNSTSVFVYNGQGDTFDGIINAIFDDEATDNYPVSGSVIGTFKPSPGMLSDFDASMLSGTWELQFSDDSFPNDGTDLLGWRIFGEADVAAPIPEPATLLLLGSGLVGLAGIGRKKFFKKK